MLHLFGFGLVFKNKLMGPSLTLEQKGQLYWIQIQDTSQSSG